MYNHLNIIFLFAGTVILLSKVTSLYNVIIDSFVSDALFIASCRLVKFIPFSTATFSSSPISDNVALVSVSVLFVTILYPGSTSFTVPENAPDSPLTIPS